MKSDTVAPKAVRDKFVAISVRASTGNPSMWHILARKKEYGVRRDYCKMNGSKISNRKNVRKFTPIVTIHSRHDTLHYRIMARIVVDRGN